MQKNLVFGTEAEVLFNEDSKGMVTVLKGIHPLRHLFPNETLDDFFQRIYLYNKYFPETKLEFYGVSDSLNGIVILFKQIYIHGNILKTNRRTAFESFNEAKIRLQEEKKLYRQVAGELKKRLNATPVHGTKTSYTTNNFLLNDIHLGNVIRGIDNRLYFIDLDISINKTMPVRTKIFEQVEPLKILISDIDENGAWEINQEALFPISYKDARDTIEENKRRLRS